MLRRPAAESSEQEQTSSWLLGCLSGNDVNKEVAADPASNINLFLQIKLHFSNFFADSTQPAKPLRIRGLGSGYRRGLAALRLLGPPPREVPVHFLFLNLVNFIV